MSKSFIILFCLLVMSACGGQKTVSEVVFQPHGDYRATATEYGNTYNAESLLVKVVARDYGITGTFKQLEKTRTYEYTYRKLADGATLQHEYQIDGHGERVLISVTRRSPRREETIDLRGKDTMDYELKCFDAQGRLVEEISHYTPNYPEYGMVTDDYHRYLYEYDSLGREVAKTTQIAFDNEPTSNSREISVYRGDTQELVRTTETDSGATRVTEYRSERAGDTLIQKAYQDGRFSHIVKKAPGYSATWSYQNDTLRSADVEVSAGRVKTVISRDFDSRTADTLRYENGLPAREGRLDKRMYTITNYTYDSRGNVTQEREEAWFFNQ